MKRRSYNLVGEIVAVIQIIIIIIMCLEIFFDHTHNYLIVFGAAIMSVLINMVYFIIRCINNKTK